MPTGMCQPNTILHQNMTTKSTQHCLELACCMLPNLQVTLPKDTMYLSVLPRSQASRQSAIKPTSRARSSPLIKFCLQAASPASTFNPSFPAAVQWMKRRGPALQKHKVSRLFRTRHIRFLDPETNLVHRARRDRILQPGSYLLVPKFALGQDVQKLSEKTLKSRLCGLLWV